MPRSNTAACFTLVFAGLALLASCMSGPEQQPTRPDQVTLADGRRIHLYCLGSGTPTVLMDNGATSDSRVWSKVQPLLAKTTRTCVYDRAGHRHSDPGPMPRDALNVVRDMEAMITAAELKPPFVLVGHSLGAMHVRLFASRHPDEVAGIVQVDPFLEQWQEGLTPDSPLWTNYAFFSAGQASCLHALDVGAIGYDRGAACGFKSAFWSEEELALQHAVLSYQDSAYSLSHTELADARYLGSMPNIVLSADGEGWLGKNPSKLEVAIQARRTELKKALAGQSTRGEYRSVPDAGHMIMLDRPDVVIGAVDELIAKAR